MSCSKEQIAWLFYNVSTSSLLLLLLLYSVLTLLVQLLSFIGSVPIVTRKKDVEIHSVEDESDDSFFFVDCSEDYLTSDITGRGESNVFRQNSGRNILRTPKHSREFFDNSKEEEDESGDSESVQLSLLVLSDSESGQFDGVAMEDLKLEKFVGDGDSPHTQPNPTVHRDGLVEDDESSEDGHGEETKARFYSSSFFTEWRDYVPDKLESKKLVAEVKEVEDDEEEEEEEKEIFGDSTVGSTSKSSSEWRSSIRDSCTDDPFSSSSRRSCPGWESYTVYQKYDERMMFLDRISAQKLHETDSLKSIKVCPRSISDRILHKFNSISRNPVEIRHNPYHELEGAYVAQICWTWEALNWNYVNFKRKKAPQKELDLGCPASVAQMFQQFQVLLQRYVENEPYEQGRRPEVYARMRLLAPKLLLVPEFRDSESDGKGEGLSSRISSEAFLVIMEDGIRTFMNFLKADKEKTCRLLSAIFRRNRRGMVDPALLRLMKKVNKKKQMKLKDMGRARNCLIKRRVNAEEEMEILMGMIDLRLVARVLRMVDMSEQQLHWCEQKMSKLRIQDSRLQRDSSPLFFPAD